MGPTRPKVLAHGRACKMMFKVGKEYRNRKVRYVVLGIQGNILRVRFKDGSEGTLNAAIQERIIANMTRGSASNPSGSNLPSDQSIRRHTTPSPHKEVYRRRVEPLTNASWCRYDLWNEAIFQCFFSPQRSDQLVYLDIDETVIESLAPDETAKKSPEQDFIQAIRNTLGPLGINYLSPHFDRTATWKAEGGHEAPPFLGLLTSFCLAAQKMQSDEGISSHNYYVRLAHLLLGPSFHSAQKQRLQRGFSRAHHLWDALDTWLRENGGKLGLPSAQPMSRLIHVGYPISQSLLRTQDRLKLVEFFWSSGLYPGQQVSPLDLERLLDYWVPQSNLSSPAKIRWRNLSTKRKMAEVASLELSNWNGTIPDKESLAGSIVTAPIALQVMVVGGPSPRLDWDVVLRVPSDLVEITYDAVSDERKLPCMDEPCRSITVGHGLSSRWSDSIPNVSIGDLLVSQVELVDREGRNRVRWQPQKVLALGWDDELKVYRSVSHLEFAKRSMVIAFESVAPTVGSLLSGVDFGDMRKVPDNLGVPKDWVVFDNVQLSRVPDIGENPDLSPLVPEISSTVQWAGGIAFPGRKQWLASRLPVISANSIDEVEEVRAAVGMKSAFKSTERDPVQPVANVPGNALDLDLSKCNLPDGVYSLVVTAYQSRTGNRVFDLARQTFEIRSPDSRFPQTASPLRYCSKNIRWPFSALTLENDTDTSTHIVIQGASINREQRVTTPEGTLPRVLDSVSKHLDEVPQTTTEKLNRTTTRVAKCFIGAHHWVLDGVSNLPDYYRPHKGVCVNCGKTDVFRPKSFKTLLQRKSTRPAITNVAVERTVTRPSGHSASDYSERMDFDGLLEACFTWGAGAWSHFQLLARQVTSDPWFPYEAIQLFSSLGHLDVEWDIAGTLPQQWAVSPSTIVMTDHGDAFLAGYRSSSALSALRPLVESHGGKWATETNPKGPTTYRLTGVLPNTLRSVVSSILQDGGIDWQFSDRPDKSIASSLPPLWDVVGAGPQADIPLSSEHFDVSTARWSPESNVGHDGLYRTNSFPRQYFLKIGKVCRSVSYRTGKHLAGAYHHKVLLAYEPQTNRLQCPLGAQLPGLYERAVVLSSGSSPEVDLRDFKVTYHRVSQSVAEAVWRKITDLKALRGRV